MSIYWGKNKYRTNYKYTVACFLCHTSCNPQARPGKKHTFKLDQWVHYALCHNTGLNNHRPDGVSCIVSKEALILSMLCGSSMIMGRKLHRRHNSISLLNVSHDTVLLQYVSDCKTYCNFFKSSSLSNEFDTLNGMLPISVGFISYIGKRA